MLGEGVEYVGSQLAPVPLQLMLILIGVPHETPSLWRIQTLSLSTVFIEFSQS